MLGELVDAGLINDEGYAPSTGGRRPMMYALCPGKLYVVSVAMDQLATSICLVDLHNFKVEGVERFDLRLSGNPQALAELKALLCSYLERSGDCRSRIIGIGIGMPGFVDADRGINYSYLDNFGKSVSKTLQEAFQLPVYIDNDSSLIALAELKLGIAKKKKNAMVINMNWGIGLGMIINGSLFRGHNGFAGEFSHIPLFEDKLCNCLKSGCLESVASMEVLVQNARTQLAELQPVTTIKHLPENTEDAFDTLIHAATLGDRFAIELFSAAGKHIGKGLAILIHIVNPELIVLSGRGAAAGKLWLAPIQQALNRYCIPRLAEHCTLAISALNNQAELIGAAALVVENMDKEENVRDWLHADLVMASE